MPEQRQQHPYFANFQQQVAHVLYEARLKQESIPYAVVDHRVWQHIEAQLIESIYHELAM